MEPGYHTQPITLDPTKEPPADEAPRAQGHDEDLAGAVKGAIEEHKQAVEDAESAEAVGPRDAGDHAGEVEEANPPVEGTIDEVLAWVGDDPQRAQAALDAENRRSSPRSSLVTKLQEIAG